MSQPLTLEEQAILASMDEDVQRLQEVLSQMLPGERSALRSAALRLAETIFFYS